MATKTSGPRATIVHADELAMTAEVTMRCGGSVLATAIYGGPLAGSFHACMATACCQAAYTYASGDGSPDVAVCKACFKPVDTELPESGVANSVHLVAEATARQWNCADPVACADHTEWLFTQAVEGFRASL